MRTYHYSVRIGHGKTTFPTVALGSLRGSLAFFWKGRGVQSPWLAISQTYLSALFSCQRAVAKACCFHVKAEGRAGKRGLNKSCSAITACYSSVSKGISKSKIILISASLIRPFNSMSTTMQTLPYLS